MNETMPGLMEKIAIATQRVLFLLDCTLFPTEDIQLNTRFFNENMTINQIDLCCDAA
jgi:hypothetical protein